MILEENIRKWQQNIADNYCRECSDTCCDIQKHRIPLEKYSLSLFKEKGVPIIKRKQLKKSSIKKWKRSKKADLFLVNGLQVPKPSIVDIGGFLFDEYFLYADLCPFYKKGVGCEVHEDPRRPKDCKEYPLVFLGFNDSKGKLLDIEIMNTCELFNKKEIRSELEKKFPVRIIN